MPIILPAGAIAVYGIGQNGEMPSGAIIENTFRFGTIYNIWDGGAAYIYAGDVVMWEDGKELARLATEGGIYTILPAKLVTKDFAEP